MLLSLNIWYFQLQFFFSSRTTQVKINLLPGQIVDYVISGDDDYDSDFEDIPECIEVESEKVIFS